MSPPWLASRRAARALGVALGALLLGGALAAAAWGALVRAAPYPTGRLSVRDAASPVLLDRQGRALWRGAAASGQPRAWTPLHELSPLALSATLAAEDHRFYEHRGVDPLGVLRAAWLNARRTGLTYGASTLTMQLVRLLEPELDTKTLRGKLTQALHAARLERALGKRELLEQYLNRAYYGNGAFGLPAAARLYFGAPPAALSPAQAAFLAALPRAPSGYDPYRHRPRAERRKRHILARMHALGWLSAEQRQLALDAPLPLRRERPGVRARHFVDHLLVSLPERELRGARVVTSLDLELQERLELATRRHLQQVGSRAVAQAGVVVLDNRSGDILAMVGSGDYADDAAGAVNVTVVPRRAGSTLKPFVYGLALERGDSPATLAYDVVLPGESGASYTRDVRQHGFARYREALAGSYNLAAVHTLETVGVGALVERLRRAGLTTLRADHDLGLAIGDAEIRLIELAGAFATFGNAGRAVRPRAVRSLEHVGGARGAAADGVGAPADGPLEAAPSTTAVFSPAIAYQIFDILSDPDARRPMFGRTAPLELGFPVAVKTGTTRGYTDNLAFGTTREFSVGAWAGNFDGTPTEGVMAMQGAAPLVRAAFVALAALYGAPTAPDRPEELTERDVCPLSGARPGPRCSARKRELFSRESARRLENAPPCAFHAEGAGGRAGALAFPPELAHWAAAHGLRSTRAPAQPGPLVITYPPDGSTFQLDPHRPARAQLPPLRALPRAPGVRFSIDGAPASEFEPAPGRHVVEARLGAERASVEIVIE